MRTILFLIAALALTAAPAAAKIVPNEGDHGRRQVVEAEAPQARVERVCNSMKPLLGRDGAARVKEFKIEKSDEINAYADFNGRVTVTTGMLDFVKSDDELAMVCGHEMAHIAGRHLKRSIGNTLLSGLAGALASNYVGEDGGNIIGGLFQNKQSRKHEREADRIGLEIAWAAGYDPRAGQSLWKRMEEKSGGSGGDLEKYLSTHPRSGEREDNFAKLMSSGCAAEPGRAYCDQI